MTNVQAIQEAILSNPEEFGLKADACGQRPGVVVESGSLGSATARMTYRIFISGQRQPVLIAQSQPLWRPSSADPCTPFTPGPLYTESVRDLLPRRHGAIVNDSRQIFWAEFVDGSTLTTLLRKEYAEAARVIATLFARFQEPPWHLPAGSRLSPAAAVERYEGILTRASKVVPCVSEIQNLLQCVLRENLGGISFGFGHGDVWCNDVIVRPDGSLCLIDWEWSAEDYPQGFDLLSVCLSAIEKFYDVGPGDSFVCLVDGNGKLERNLRQSFRKFLGSSGYGREKAFAFLVAFLLRIQDRVIKQQAFVLGEGECRYGELLALILRDRLWLAPLIGE